MKNQTSASPNTELLPVEAPQSHSLAVATPNTLLQLAVEKGASLEQLEKLMALSERWEANEARKAFVVAMAEFKSNPPEIVKDKSVSFQTSKGTTSYDHATLGNVTSAVCAGLAKHGLSHRWDVKQADGKITVVCTITHAKGHSESVQMTAGADDSGGKNSIQQIASTVSYLQRYTLLSATGLATHDQDDDAAHADDKTTMTDEHVATITAKCEEISKTMKGTVLKSYSVAKLEDIPDEEYERIIHRLEATKRDKGGAK